jgi:hypothetical protein
LFIVTLCSPVLWFLQSPFIVLYSSIVSLVLLVYFHLANAILNDPSIHCAFGFPSACHSQINKSGIKNKNHKSISTNPVGPFLLHPFSDIPTCGSTLTVTAVYALAATFPRTLPSVLSLLPSIVVSFLTLHPVLCRRLYLSPLASTSRALCLLCLVLLMNL